MTEYTIQSRVGTDSSLHLNVPEEWANQDVTVTIKTREKSKAPMRNFAKALQAKAGGCSFDVPADIHERKGELFTEIVSKKHHTNVNGQDA